MNKSKVKVIYIVGEGRSGSTLFERILGQHDKIFAAGELIHIWERGFIDNQLCSCGEPFNKCKVWKNIITRFIKKYKKGIEPNSVIEALLKTSRMRHYLIKKNFDNKYAKFINEIYTHLYEAIIESTGSEFVIDASKHPVFAYILTRNKNLDLYIIHLVRDSRGVAYSWTRRKIRPEIISRKEYMPRYSVFKSSLSWMIVNKIALDLKNRNNVKYLLIRYEDLILKPQETLAKVCNFLKLDPDFKQLFIKRNIIHLMENHTVAGNPIRFKTGDLQLKLDEEWKYKMRRDLRLFTTLITFPYLKKFKYI